jgi:GTP-binding protein
MKISSVKFVKSAVAPAGLIKDDKPQIAFLGRSNVGKSSLINSLLQRKGLARASNTPGRTRSINYFDVNDSFYFVDLPGYGYAKVPRAQRQSWGELAESFLADNESLALCIQLIDARHGPKDTDLQLYEWLVKLEMPLVIVTTKADKIGRNSLARSLNLIRREMPGVEAIPYSSVTGLGRDKVLDLIKKTLSDRKK